MAHVHYQVCSSALASIKRVGGRQLCEIPLCTDHAWALQDEVSYRIALYKPPYIYIYILFRATAWPVIYIAWSESNLITCPLLIWYDELLTLTIFEISAFLFHFVLPSGRQWPVAEIFGQDQGRRGKWTRLLRVSDQVRRGQVHVHCCQRRRKRQRFRIAESTR